MNTNQRLNDTPNVIFKVVDIDGTLRVGTAGVREGGEVLFYTSTITPAKIIITWKSTGGKPIPIQGPPPFVLKLQGMSPGEYSFKISADGMPKDDHWYRIHILPDGKNKSAFRYYPGKPYALRVLEFVQQKSKGEEIVVEFVMDSWPITVTPPSEAKPIGKNCYGMDSHGKYIFKISGHAPGILETAGGDEGEIDIHPP